MFKSKKILTIVVVLALIALAASFIRYNDVDANAQELENLQSEGENVENLGDVNGDGNINSLDASIIMRMSPKIALNVYDEEYPVEPADVDGDDRITGYDAVLILEYAAIKGANSGYDKTLEEYVQSKNTENN